MDIPFCLQAQRAISSQPTPTKAHQDSSRREITLTCSLGEQFKSSGCESGLFNKYIMFRSGVTMAFAELPKRFSNFEHSNLHTINEETAR
jgi:hypothetical protein